MAGKFEIIRRPQWAQMIFPTKLWRQWAKWCGHSFGPRDMYDTLRLLSIIFVTHKLNNIFFYTTIPGFNLKWALILMCEAPQSYMKFKCVYIPAVWMIVYSIQNLEIADFLSVRTNTSDFSYRTCWVRVIFLE